MRKLACSVLLLAATTAACSRSTEIIGAVDAHGVYGCPSEQSAYWDQVPKQNYCRPTRWVLYVQCVERIAPVLEVDATKVKGYVSTPVGGGGGEVDSKLTQTMPVLLEAARADGVAKVCNSFARSDDTPAVELSPPSTQPAPMPQNPPASTAPPG